MPTLPEHIAGITGRPIAPPRLQGDALYRVRWHRRHWSPESRTGGARWSSRIFVSFWGALRKAEALAASGAVVEIVASEVGKSIAWRYDPDGPPRPPLPPRRGNWPVEGER